ncbi:MULTISPECIES: haloacid dehalogenase type II [Streptomyces]|uniref:haloacid dehalogenase type II n=1 Tax=Streptomyces TaxID=1883 RepID=UPI0004AB995C|nr:MULTISPECIES: haloacid dehalogenase type II [Streptomyces]MCX4711310.1 haloacid dehalogenase type II [Streptomyces griseus]MDX2673328.1 haloacid dehalogenase type II [Streptomyces sp. NRRL_ISP-5395]QXQ99114.1 haloacid dehalogenase type II [Streptomyces sp. WY228]GHF82378.1 haloacid dehalogenase [Streptomyces griseus]
MAELKIDALVFDVLGTLVDEPAGLRAGIRALGPSAGLSPGPSAVPSVGPSAVPSLDAPGTERLLLLWQRHIEREQRRILDGDRPYLPSDALDREAARIVAEAAGVEDSAAVQELAGAARRLPPWPDTVAGLARLAGRFPLIGLSNASRTALLELNAHAGLRWHQALSAEDARAYKPDPAVYRLAVTVAGRPPERLLMVAAHAWDLRGAQALGLRTAYVARPVGDPPAPSDRFDLYAEDLADLARQLELPRGV